MDNTQCIDILRKVRQRALTMTTQQLVTYLDGQIDALETVDSDNSQLTPTWMTRSGQTIPESTTATRSRTLSSTPRFRGADMA